MQKPALHLRCKVLQDLPTLSPLPPVTFPPTAAPLPGLNLPPLGAQALTGGRELTVVSNGGFFMGKMVDGFRVKQQDESLFQVGY